MRLLVGLLQRDAVIAGVLSIATCAILNFLLSDRWVFPASGRPQLAAEGLQQGAQD